MVSCLKLNITAIKPLIWCIQTNPCNFIILNYPDVLYTNVYESQMTVKVMQSGKWNVHIISVLPPWSKGLFKYDEIYKLNTNFYLGFKSGVNCEWCTTLFTIIAATEYTVIVIYWT